MGAAHSFENDDWMLYTAHCGLHEKDIEMDAAFQFALWKNLSVIPSMQSYVDLIGIDVDWDPFGLGLGFGAGVILDETYHPIGYVFHIEGGEEGLPWEKVTMSCTRQCDYGACPCDPTVPDNIIGQSKCCTKERPCIEGHGDCDKHEDCQVSTA